MRCRSRTAPPEQGSRSPPSAPASASWAWVGFAGPGQVSGTKSGPLVTGGVYRWSRNPQYAGYVAALTGLALARRSGAGLFLAAAAGASYAAWVPVEEEHLGHELGPAYEAYLSRTPRWLGRPRTTLTSWSH